MLAVHPQLRRWLGVALVAVVLVPSDAGGVIVSTKRSSITYARDWLASFDVGWTFEEPANTDAADMGIGGDDDLTDVGTTGRSTSNFRFGLQAADLDSGTNYFTCADASCPSLDPQPPGASLALTIGCAAIRYTSATTSLKYAMRKQSTGGYSFGYRPSAANGVLLCSASRSGGGTVLSESATSTTTDTFYSAACTIVNPSGSGLTVTAYHNGAAATPGTHGNNFAQSNETFALPSASTSQLIGQLDDCYAIYQEVTTAELSRVNSCGLDGTRCVCVDASSAGYKECTTNGDCGTTGVCDTEDAATNDPNCAAADDGAAGAGCCMGYNSSLGGGVTIEACNDTTP